MLLDGDPVATLSEDGAIEVFSRGVADHLLRFRLPEGGRWTAQDLTEHAAGGSPSLTVASRPCIAGTAAGLRHVLGRNADGDVVHFVGFPDGGWTAENLTLDRITIGPSYRIEGQPRAAAGGNGVLLAGRKGAELLLYRWHAGGAWTAENLTVERGAKDDGPRIASDPALACSREAVHVLALSSGGSLVEYRVDVSMAPARRAGGGAVGLSAVTDWFAGLVARLRELSSGRSRPAVGLRASPMTEEPVEEPAAPENQLAAEKIAAEAIAGRPATVTEANVNAAAQEESVGDTSQLAGGIRDEGDGAKGGESWGHRTSAAAPWHEEDDAGLVERDADDASPPASDVDESSERDLLRQGSEWSGPRLVPERGAAASDDWDRALEDVGTADEPSVVDSPAEEFVDEDDHASARIFLAPVTSEDPLDAGEVPDGNSVTDAPPRTEPAAEPTTGQDVRGAAAAAPREPATDSVPGRPLVDLSFLSDIVPAGGSSGTTSADAGAPVPAESTRTTTPAPAVASGPAGAPATAPAESEPAVAPPSAAEPNPGAQANGHQPSSLPNPVTATGAATSGSAAAPGQQATTGPAADPVVDFDFLANAGEYVGGGKHEAGMKEFLQFLAQG